jgi:hypothetical protein
MCTVTWVRTTDGYELFCNRDEKLTRLRAIGPALAEQEGVMWMAPLDGNFGGTWVGVNHLGVTVCLLNGEPADGSPERISRGLLARALLSRRTADEVSQYLVDKVALGDYSAFTLVAIESDRPAIAIAWDRTRLITHPNADHLQPFTSSAFEPEKIAAYRRALYMQEGVRGVAFHAAHQFGKSPWSVCMHREDAETVSFTRVSVTRRHVSLLYSPVAPCAGIRGTPVSLPRVA